MGAGASTQASEQVEEKDTKWRGEKINITFAKNVETENR